jgi:hypothetical protein
MRGILDTPLCYKACQWLAAGQWFSPGTPVYSTNKTDCYDITEILLKVALNSILITPIKEVHRCPCILILFNHLHVLICYSNPGGYMWTQTVWNIGGYSLDSLSNDHQVNVSFQLQMCRNIPHPMFKGCNSTGAAYSVSLPTFNYNYHPPPMRSILKFVSFFWGGFLCVF